MLVVLDSNQYIFTFGPRIKPSCKDFLTKIPVSPNISVRITRLIVKEVRMNLSLEAFNKFIQYINILTTIDENLIVPFGTAFKYETKGLKPADAFIAAYTEWVGADILVSENRHFLSRHKGLPFKILTAKKFLKLI